MADGGFGNLNDRDREQQGNSVDEREVLFVPQDVRDELIEAGDERKIDFIPERTLQIVKNVDQQLQSAIHQSLERCQNGLDQVDKQHSQIVEHVIRVGDEVA